MAKTVFITGASSGLGLAMAKKFAQRGYNLALSARREIVLAELADDIRRDSEVTVNIYPLDVTDGEQISEMLNRAHKEMGQLDIVVASAGLGYMPDVGAGALNEIKQMIDANVFGLIATVDVAINIFREQGFGQIVGLSSVAADRAAPANSSVYSATKAAVTTYLRGVQLATLTESIDVTILAPGYIDTPMNQGTANRPFLISVDKGAILLVDRIEQKVAHTYVPMWPWAVMGRFLRYAPAAMVAKMTGA